MKVGGWGTYYFYHNDHLGTSQKMTAENGEVVWSAKYNSFGEAEVEVNTIENNLRLPGQYFDQENGLHYNYHRYYDPMLGRYLRNDPIGLKGGINQFTYSIGNPISRFDSRGLFCGCDSACPSGSYSFTGVDYGGFLFFGGVTAKHLIFKCMGGKDTFKLIIRSVSLGGGLGGGVQLPSGIVAGCNKNDVKENIAGFGTFLNIFPPGIPTKPGFGIGGDIGTNSISGDSPSPLPSANLSPGYGLEVSAGGSYSWIVE